MPRQVQENALLGLALFGVYLACGGLGLFARLILFISPFSHIFFGIMHVLLGVLLITLQSIHLAHHFKWIKTHLHRQLNSSQI
jgi:tellurite resistance protein TehA-like permease